MAIRVRSIVMMFAVASSVGACVADTGPAAPAPEQVERAATFETVAPVASSIEALATTTCFTCDLDPSIRSCSTDAKAAQWRCQRACVVCDDFGDNQGECFVGTCFPE